MPTTQTGESLFPAGCDEGPPTSQEKALCGVVFLNESIGQLEWRRIRDLTQARIRPTDWHAAQKQTR